MTSTTYFVIAGLCFAIMLSWFVELRLWPTFQKMRPVRGLGDAVAIVLTALGFSSWEGCGCDERRTRWNNRWPLRWYALQKLEVQLKEQAIQTQMAREALQALVTEAEAFKVHALALLSKLHERLVRRESFEHAWYVSGTMDEVAPFLEENGLSARTIEQANLSSLADDSPGALLAAQDEAVEPVDYSSRR